MSYEIKQFPHGVGVFGSIPVSDFAALVKAWEDRGWDLADAIVAQKLGASIVVTSEGRFIGARSAITGTLGVRAGRA